MSFRPLSGCSEPTVKNGGFFVAVRYDNVRGQANTMIAAAICVVGCPGDCGKTGE